MKRLTGADCAHMSEVQMLQLLYSDLLRLRNAHETGWSMRERERALDRSLVLTRELRLRAQQLALFPRGIT